NTTLSTLATSSLATLDSLFVTNTATVGGTLDVTGLATFNGGATVPTGQTFLASGAATFTPNANNSVTINTNPSNSSFLTLTGLTTAPGNALCIDGSNH